MENSSDPFDRCLLALLALTVRLAFPADFRARFGRDLVKTLAADARAPSGRLSIRRSLAAAASLVRDGWSERLARRQWAQLPVANAARRVRFPGWTFDVRLAIRTLGHQPLYSAAVIGTLAVGLGASTAMFSVLDAVALRPLPYPHAASLVRIEEDFGRNVAGASFPALTEWAGLPSIARTGAYTEQLLLFKEGGDPERVRGTSVSPGFFDTLGNQAALGRLLPGDGPLLNPDPQIVLGHRLWQRQFAGTADVLNRTLTLEGKAFRVVGVMPPGFEFPPGAEFWTTLPLNMKAVVEARSLPIFEAIARLAPGRTFLDLERDLAEWQARVAPLLSEKDRQVWRVGTNSLHDEVVAPVRPALRAAMAGVVLLLIVSCANVAALMLARGRARAGVLSLQSALGASRGRLIRQQLAETLLLALCGAVAGLAVASVAARGMVALGADQIPRIATIAIDTRVALFACACGLAAALAAGLGPAILLTRPVPVAALQLSTQKVAGSRAGRRVFGALVALEFAIAMTLVAGAGLLLSSYRHLRQVRTGVDPVGVGVAQLNVPLTPAWRADGALRAFTSDLLEGVRSLPDVAHAAFVSRLPLDVARGGIQIKVQGGAPITTVYVISSEGYLATIGARLLAGRDLEAHDTEGARPVAVINDVLARQLFGSPDEAIDRLVEFDFMRGPVALTVVGVAEAIRHDGLQGSLRPELYQTYRQATVFPGSLVYRTGKDPLQSAPAIRSVLARSDPTGTITLEHWTTMETRMSRAIAQPRFFLVVTGVFAAVALVLAGFGIYGTLSFWVAERRRELGIRLALGASGSGVAKLVVGRGLALATAGVATGLAASVASSRLLSNLLFEVSPTDVWTLGLAASILMAVAVAVCVIPARRAMRTDPLESLRAQGV